MCNTSASFSRVISVAHWIQIQIDCTPIYLTQGLENDVTARLRSIRLSHDCRRHVSRVSQQTNAVSSQPSHVTDTSATNAVRQACSQPSDNGGVVFLRFWTFRCLKIGSSWWLSRRNLDFYRAMLCISAVYAGMRCLYVCPSVWHVRGSCQNE